VVEDGEYHLEYIFNGRNETADVRVRAGMLLSKAT
jgi:hypothetical protein